MTGHSRLLACAALLAAGCAGTPPAPPQDSAAFVAGSGLVIGTLSWRYIDAGAAPAWEVHLERLDAPAQQEYALPVDTDPDSRSGVFTGTLPAGVYTFRDAAAAQRRFGAGTLGMPFEVRAGEVRDAGHYTLNPVVSRR